MSSVEISKLAYEGKTAEVKEKISANPSLAKLKDDAGRIPLHWACVGGHVELVLFLLEKSGDLDMSDDTGWTPLMIASSAGRLEIVKHLMSCGADVNATNDNKQTPLHYAASKAHLEIVRLLLEHGANVNAQDHVRNTPLHRAASRGNTKVVGLLLSTPKCESNLPDIEGNTPLHLACEEGRRDEALMLVKAGAHLDKRNRAEKTPLDLAEPGLRKALQRLTDSG